MSPLKKMTPSIERQITNDWHRELPSLGIYRPRWLLRRVGPLLAGVLLERDSVGDAYMPKFHVHFLGREHDGVVLMLCTQLRNEQTGGPSFVDLRWHEEKYKEAASRMARQCPLALGGNLRVDDVLAAYRTQLATPLGARTAAQLYTDMILLLAWARRTDEASRALDEALAKLGDDETPYQHVGGKKTFEATCREAIDNPTSVDRTVEDQTKALELQGLPAAELLP